MNGLHRPPLRNVLSACIMLSLLASACAPRDLRQSTRDMGIAQGFAEQLLPTPYFTLYSQYRQGRGNTLHVYIEGDGHAWLNRTTPSDDPTPHNPMGLLLALNDPSPCPVLYLARPCQYVGARQCDRRYWTDARMHEHVIAALGTAIDKVKAASGTEHVVLVGFSGGGGCAVLLAAQRNDVVFLGTVAGNVHVAAWTELHQLSPLTHSLEPFAAAPLVRHIPQRHLAGDADSIIPPELSKKFCQAVGRPESCRTVHGIGHHGAWQNIWDYSYPAAGSKTAPETAASSTRQQPHSGR